MCEEAGEEKAREGFERMDGLCGRGRMLLLGHGCWQHWCQAVLGTGVSLGTGNSIHELHVGQFGGNQRGD